jgi:U2 small nuclear ribonucleoprotein A'
VSLWTGGRADKRAQNYRYWVLWRAPQIRFLDYQKVKDLERSKAKELFGTFENPTELAQSIMAVRSSRPMIYGAPTTNGVSKAKKSQLTAEEKARYQVLINKATTLAEVQKLEKMLNEGRVPPAVDEVDAMDET